MNPLKFKQAMDYLTRIKKVKPDLPEVFPASQAPVPSKKESLETMEAINEFVLRNPRQDMAGGGMLVQPGFGGTRQGYREDSSRVKYKVITELSKGDKINFKYPKDHKYKVQVPTRKDLDLGSLRTFSAKTKKELQDIVDKAPITNKDYTEGLVKTKLSEGVREFDKNRVKIPTDEFVGEGKNRSRIFKIQNKDGTNVRYTATGAGGGKKKLYNSIEEVKKAKLDFTPDILVKQSSRRIKENISEVVYKNKKTGKIVKKYKPFIGPDKVTIEGKGADTLKEAEKFVDNYFEKNPKKIRVADPTKDYTSKKVRKKALLETDPTGAIGTKKFQYHHIRQIAGGTPLTTDDVMIINQRINSALGTKYNKPLNAISEAIRKNNRLALEAMNSKQEGLALDYMKRVDDLNIQAEKIVNSAIDNLPKKYKGYVGFNAVELPRDEYGLPIGNEPARVRKIGGRPVSKDAIDLTTLNLKQEKEFRRIVREQAERGQIGRIKPSQIKNIRNMLGSTQLNAKIPIIQDMMDVARSIPGDVAKKSYFKAAGKAAGLAIAPVILYDTYKALEQGKPLLESLEQGFIGTNLIGGTKDILSLNPEERMARSVVKQDALKDLNLDMPMGFGFIEGPTPQTNMTLPEAQQKMDAGIQRVQQERAQRESDIAANRANFFGNLKNRVFDIGGIGPDYQLELAGGGIAKEAGDPSGAMLESMNPDSQGLPGLLKRVRNR